LTGLFTGPESPTGQTGHRRRNREDGIEKTDWQGAAPGVSGNNVQPQRRTTRVTTRTMLMLFAAFVALGSGVFNFRDRLNQKLVPTDGVIWRDEPGLGVRAAQVEPGSPAALADVRRGDYLIGISTTGSEPFEMVEEAQHVQIYLDQAKDQLTQGAPLTLSYWIERRNDAGDTVLREGIADLDRLETQETHLLRGGYLALIGLIYLGVGLYFLMKQGRAPYVGHFFLICLLAFMAHFYSPTIEMRTHFDKAIDLADIFSLILLPPLLVHFAAIYPSHYARFTRRRWAAPVCYGTAGLLLIVELMLRFAPLRSLLLFPVANLRSILNRVEIVLFAISLVASALLFIRTFRETRSIIVRQQLKWVIWGMSVAAVTFGLFYLPSFLAIESVASVLTMSALAPLILIPVTLGYSIVRYRLMDVDVVMRRSFAYIIATLSVAALFGTVMAISYEVLRSMIPQEATLLIAAVTMSIIAMLFAPVKNWVQERIDRLFYGEKYDYRLTLQDFGRTLSSTTELDPLLVSLSRRLKEVFSIERLAIFIEDRQTLSGFKLAHAAQADLGEREVPLPADFIRLLREKSIGTGIVRIDNLEVEEAGDPMESIGSSRSFSYYVPCAARSRIVAVIALGRTIDGALLSSEDMGLLRAISGYVAVAIENALLLAEQAQRAKELARLKEFNENIIESINVGVLVIDLSGRITNWNGALEEIYGLPRQKAIGRLIGEIFEPGMLRALREMTDAANKVTRQRGEPTNIYKFRARAFDGRDLILNISLAPLHSKNEELEGTLVAIEDVTERIRLEEQLQQSDKLSSIGLLAAGVAHEVNTPLTGISSYSQMLMQQIPETDSRHQLLQKIYRQTSRASSIVNNLLNFSRVSDARFVAIEINRVLDDTIQLLEAQLHNTSIEVVRSYAESLPLAPGNAPKLQQVFMNLILNARDAMPRGGRLEISTSCDDRSIVISFRDSGEGIPAEHLSRIYDPFFTTKQIGKGTGLGLAVSYGIVQDHGGQITVESNAGDGTCFLITLPLANSQLELATAGD
jgi:two-component system NtrC family sensor kinase